MPLHRLLALGALLLPLAASATQVLSSGPERVRLLELYTSEGCSSCPPADRWLSGLRGDPRLWSGLVPLAFHVDYWDYIGWQDRFASPEHSARQRRHAALGNVSTVYTPGFVVDGREWREWFGARELRPAGDRPGALEARVNADVVTVRFTPRAAMDGPLEVHLARLGFDLRTPVRAGENAGRLLAHDFVVLGLASARLHRHADAYEARLGLPPPAVAGARTGHPVPGSEGLAVWVTEAGQLRPLQALGGYLAGP